MRKRQWVGLPLAAMVSLTLVACEEGAPTGLADGYDAVTEVVFTQGVPAPAKHWGFPFANATWDGSKIFFGGSETGTVPLACEVGETGEIEVEFAVKGNLQNTATYTVPTLWTYNGEEWVPGEDVATVTVNAQTPQNTAYDTVTVTLVYGSGTPTAETSTFEITPTVTNSGGSGDGNSLPNPGEGDAAIVEVEFVGCGGNEPENTAPWLRVPRRVVAEANLSADDDHSQSGALVTWRVRAWDREDGNLSDRVVCKVGDDTVQSGDRFAIGATEVTCSVTDDGGLTTEKNFTIHVQDTTAPVFLDFPDDDRVVAPDIRGVLLDLSDYDLRFEDKGPESEPGDISPEVTRVCTVTVKRGEDLEDKVTLVEGEDYIGIGETAKVTCTITDGATYRAPREKAEAPNRRTESFTIFVDLDLSPECMGEEFEGRDRHGLGTPLRIAGDPSAHKANSAIPHKLCPPLYADGRPATDLADGFRLTVTWQDGDVGPVGTVFDDPAAGSTQWRYDAQDDHYIFNAKTDRKWKAGAWETEVSYAGIVLGWTTFVLR